jgi:hypothetical protein
MSSIRKTCFKCGKEKPLSAFMREKKGRHGLRGSCKDCERPMFHESRLKQVFGITLAEYNRMYESQGGVCAICGLPERRTEGPGVTAKLCVDHDHKTGKVRGLLCRTCNSALGLVNDDISVLLRCMEYLVKNS